MRDTTEQNSTVDRGEAGFTLLEMLVALVILAAVAALALPAAKNTRSGLELRAAALDLAGTFRTSRAEAIKSNTQRAVTLDAGSRRYFSDVGSGSRAIPASLGIGFEMPVAEKTLANGGRVRFLADGSATGGTVILKDRRRSAVITVEPLTGATRISWR